MKKKYVPDSLTEEQKKKQIKSIKQGKRRPKLDVKTRRSKWTLKAEKYFNKPPTLLQLSKASNVPQKALKEIIERGKGAYYSSGSRPNTTPTQWGRARLYAVLFGGKKARKADNDIIEKYNIPILS